MNQTLRAEHVTTIVELQDWCRRLHREGPHPCEPLRRFAIGIYQIYQAFDWAGTESEHESWAAAGIHILATAEAFDVPTEQAVAGAKLIVDIPLGVGSIQGLLYNISKLQGQYVYATNLSSIKRKSRFNRDTAAYGTWEVVRTMLGRIPSHKRDAAIYKAMETMTGEL